MVAAKAPLPRAADRNAGSPNKGAHTQLVEAAGPTAARLAETAWAIEGPALKMVTSKVVAPPQGRAATPSPMASCRSANSAWGMTLVATVRPAIGAGSESEVTT